MKINSLCLGLLLAFSQLTFGAEPNQLYQYSTINSLLQGNYDGELTIQKLSKQGNFGLGTYNNLDGEMIVLDGVNYQIKSDGKAYLATPDMKTPFAMVNQFKSDTHIIGNMKNAQKKFASKSDSGAKPLPQKVDKNKDESEGLSFSELEHYLDSVIDQKNHIQAIRIEGTFKKLTLRSIPAQKPPYRPLAEVAAKDQVTFHYKNQRGTLVGYRFPNYMKNFNVAGYHFHFIDPNRKFGGHVLSMQTGLGDLDIDIDNLNTFKMTLPDDPVFSKMDLDNQDKKALKKVEKGS